MPKGGGGGFNFLGGGKRPKAGGGGNVHPNVRPGKDDVKIKVTPVKPDGAVKPGVLRRMSTGLFGNSNRIPKVHDHVENPGQQQKLEQQRRLEEQHRLEQQQKEQRRLEDLRRQALQPQQGHRVSPEFGPPPRVEPNQQNHHGNPQFRQQDFNHLSPHRPGHDFVGGRNGERFEQQINHRRRHSAEPLRHGDWHDWEPHHHQPPQNQGFVPAVQPQLDHERNPRPDPFHHEPQHGHVGIGRQNVLSQQLIDPKNGLRIPPKPAVQVVAPPVEKEGEIAQRVKVPGFVAAGATAAGTALVEQVLTQGGNVVRGTIANWWSGDDDTANQNDSKQDGKVEGNAQKPAPSIAVQQPNIQQPTSQQPNLQQRTLQQPAFQQPVFQQPSKANSQHSPPQEHAQQPAPSTNQQHQTPPSAEQNYYFSPPINAAQDNDTSTFSSSPIPGPLKPYYLQERPNVRAGDELIFPRHFPLYKLTTVTWYDDPTKWQEDYLFFLSWNRTSAKSVLTFVAKKFVTMGHEYEHVGAHFKNMYPQLWRDPDARKDRGGYFVVMDKLWQWGRLGGGSERFVVYHEHAFEQLYDTSFTSSLWHTAADNASSLTRFDDY